MSDRMILTLMAAFAALMIAFAAVWPQGLGDRSPGPFGHTPIERTPAMRAALMRANDLAQQRIRDQKASAEQAKRAAAERTGPLRLSPHARPLVAPQPPTVGGLRPTP
jgi:hypothetical protein